MDSQFFKMYITAFNLCAFFVAEVVGEETALGLDHKVEAFGAVFLHEHGPVGVVGAEGSGDFEPTWELSINLDGFVLL